LTREAVVAAATPPGHPLHDQFEWDDAKAAHLHRLDQAQELIARSVIITITHLSTVYKAPNYVRDPTAMANEQGHVSIEDTARDSAVSILTAEIDRIESAISRGRALAGYFDSKFPGLAVDFESMLSVIAEARGKLRRAAE
jgi:hypothetical protein